MPDEHQRRLERRALTGALEDRAALLRMRARRGSVMLSKCPRCEGEGSVPSDNSRAGHRAAQVDRRPRGREPKRDAVCPICWGKKAIRFPWGDRIALASYCGDPAARLLVTVDEWGRFCPCGASDGDSGFHSERSNGDACGYCGEGDDELLGPIEEWRRAEDLVDLQAWLSGLPAWPREVWSMAAIGMARAALPRWVATVTEGCCWNPNDLGLCPEHKQGRSVVLRGLDAARALATLDEGTRERVDELAVEANGIGAEFAGHALEVCTSSTSSGRMGHMHSVACACAGFRRQRWTWGDKLLRDGARVVVAAWALA